MPLSPITAGAGASAFQLTDTDASRPERGSLDTSARPSASAGTSGADATLRPLKGALVAMSGQIPKGSMIRWHVGANAFTMVRSPNDGSLQIGFGDLHLGVSMCKDQPVELNGGPVDDDSVDEVADLLRAARDRLVSGVSDTAPARPRTREPVHDAPPGTVAMPAPLSLRHAQSNRASQARLISGDAQILPNAERAYIDMNKLTHYALNPDHYRGKTKAQDFKHMLGFDRSNATQLRDVLLDGIKTTPGVRESQGRWTSRYSVAMPVKTERGFHIVKSVWELTRDKGYPCLVTVMIAKPQVYWERLEAKQLQAQRQADAVAAASEPSSGSPR